jgi:hypothetical protein
MSHPKADELIAVIILALTGTIVGIVSGILAWVDGASLAESIQKGGVAFSGWMTLGIVVAVSLGLLR